MICSLNAIPSFKALFAEIGTKIIKTQDIIVPMKIYGVLLPHFVFVLSDNLPNSGSINKESKLSSPMINPLIVWESPKAFSKSSGITKSYAPQKVITIAKAKPTLMVFLHLISFDPPKYFKLATIIIC